MKNEISNFLIKSKSKINEALKRLNILGQDAILFVVDSNFKLIGSVTDGDVRRGLLKGNDVSDHIDLIIQKNPKFLNVHNMDLELLIRLRESKFKIIPIVDNNMLIIDILNFRIHKSFLPVDVVIMAGGRGNRLKPLTNKLPKPLLKVGDKPIIEHNLDRLIFFGIKNFWITLNYMGQKIENFLGDGSSKNVSISYINEDQPLGTIGSVSKIKDFKNEYVLVTNSDLLTNLDYESFFLQFIKSKADLSILTIPYDVDIPYAILNTNDKNMVSNFEEKPKYTYQSNGGIYLIKRDILNEIPEESFYDATDLIETLIKKNKAVISYPYAGYWLDIGNHGDYSKAQVDLSNIKF